MIEHPFRVFFPLATIGMWFAISLWVLADLPRAYAWHGELMVGLFLLPVSCGFLLYTLPRFFSSFRAGRAEVLGAFALSLLMLIAALLDSVVLYGLAKAALLIHLVVFALRRYPPRGQARPIYTPFLLAGILLGMSGACVQVCDRIFELERLLGGAAATAAAGYGRLAFQQGFFWVLFAGIGIRLFPMLTLVTHPPRMPAWRMRLAYSPVTWRIVAWSLAATFVLEALALRPVARGLRLALMCFIAFEGWLLFKKPLRPGVVAYMVKLVLATMLAGQVVVLFVDVGMAKHAGHLGFGALAIGTLLVMTRVLLAHEGGDLQLEAGSPIFALAFGLLYIAVVARALGVWLFPAEVFLDMLAVTGSLWIAASVLLATRVALAIRWRPK